MAGFQVVRFRVVSRWFRRVYPRRTVGIAAAITLIVWFAGPFGTFEGMHPVFRLVYWGGLIFGSVPVAFAMRHAVNRRFPQLSGAGAALVIASSLSLAYTPVVYFATRIAVHYGFANTVPLWVLWAGTFLAAACAYAVRRLLIEQETKVVPQPSHPDPRLLQRIDSDLHAPLVAISVRDHYVDVRTRAGMASLLMRFSDAMAETEGVEGAQVHRSHWVAWAEVQAVERQGDKVMLRMDDDLLIPVSRNHRNKLDGRGLI